MQNIVSRGYVFRLCRIRWGVVVSYFVVTQCDGFGNLSLGVIAQRQVGDNDVIHSDFQVFHPLVPVGMVGSKNSALDGVGGPAGPHQPYAGRVNEFGERKVGMVGRLQRITAVFSRD